MEKDGTLLAILGRGIQCITENGPWDLTEDIEVCDEKFAHLSVRASKNDNNPNSIVGGGWLNLLAGLELIKRIDPLIVVCAFGHRSNYLKSIGAPSESQVMSALLNDKLAKMDWIPLPSVKIFDEKEWIHVANSPSNTLQELHNVFDLASTKNIANVAIVTVTVHVWRTTLMAQRLISSEEKFRNLHLQVYASENVLTEADFLKYGARCRNLHNSRSFQRNFWLEQQGVNALLSGNYKVPTETTK